MQNKLFSAPLWFTAIVVATSIVYLWFGMQGNGLDVTRKTGNFVRISPKEVGAVNLAGAVNTQPSSAGISAAAGSTLHEAERNSESSPASEGGKTSTIPAGEQIGSQCYYSEFGQLECTEPNSSNYNMPASGLYAEQVNRSHYGSRCRDLCGDAMPPLNDTYADQIDQPLINEKAKHLGFDVEHSEPLKPVADASHPPI